jgi:hypothetical protein
MRKVMLFAVGLLLLVPVGGAAAANGCETDATAPPTRGGCVVDVSGIWEGTFQGQVFSGGVSLMITQNDRRFIWFAVASDAMFASGDGTIAAGPKGDVNAHIMGSGPLLKKIDAHGMVLAAGTEGVTAQFQFDAIYADGTHDSGMVMLAHVIREGGG